MNDGKKTPGYGGFFPGHGVHGMLQSDKIAGYDDAETGMVNNLTEKLCPFDKNPCIRERCAVYREEAGVCAFLLAGRMGVGPPSSVKNRTGDQSGGKFKAHLFD